MNKLFTKVAALTIGVAMAAGVGVALGSASASEVKAADSQYVKVSSLAAGKEVLIVSHCTSGTYSGQYYVVDAVTAATSAGPKVIKVGAPVDNIITGNLDANLFTVAASSTSWTFQTGNKYLVLGAPTNNNGARINTDTANRAWAYSSGILSNPGNGTTRYFGVYNDTDWRTYNASNASNYAGSGENVEFYEKVAVTTPFVSLDAPSMTELPFGYEVDSNLKATSDNFAGEVTYTWSATENAQYVTVTPNEQDPSKCVVTSKASNTGTSNVVVTIKVEASDGTSSSSDTVNITIVPVKTIAEARAAASSTPVKAFVAGKIYNVASYNSTYKSITYWISEDGTGSTSSKDGVQIYSGLGLYGAEFSSVDDLAQGDEVVVYGDLKDYNGTKELDKNNFIVNYVANPDVPEIPEPDMVTGKKLSDLFADTAGNGKQLYEVTGVVSNWKNATSTDATAYGNFYLKESLDSDTEYYIYGATADASKLVWSTTTGSYSFSNPQDFLTNDVTKDVVIGSTLTMRLTRCDYNTTLEATGIVVSVVPPAASDWTDAQKEDMAGALDGFVSPYFGPIVGDLEASGSSVTFTLEGEKVDEVNSYFTTNNWEAVDAGSYRKETTDGNGVVVGNASTSATGTLVSFYYYEYYTVTVEQDSHSDEIKVPDGDVYLLPQPDSTYTPAGKEFVAWGIGDVNYQPGAEYTVESDVTVTAIYQDEAQSEWTPEQVAAFEAQLDGYVPPFFGELASDLTVSSNYIYFLVSGNVVADVAGKLGVDWIQIDESDDFDVYRKTTANGVIDAMVSLEGNNTFISFQFNEPAPAAGWTDAQKEALETALHGYLPPYFGELVEDLATTENSASYIVEGDTYLDAFGSSLGDGWVLTSSDSYFVTYTFEGDGYYLTGRAEIMRIRTNLPAGDYTTFSFAYNEGDVPASDWSDEFKALWNARFVDSQGTAEIPPFFGPDISTDENVYWHPSYPYADIDLVDNDGSIFAAIDDTIYDESEWLYLGTRASGYGYIYCDPTETAYAVTYRYQDNQGNIHSGVTFEMIGGIVVETAGAQTNYFVGDTLDTTGLVVHFSLIDGEYANNENFVIPLSYCTPDITELDTAGQVTITLDIAGIYQVSYNVTVQEVVLESLSVSGTPTKTEYEAGEDWSVEGLTVTAHYNNGAEVDVTDQATWSFDPEESAASVTSVSAVAHFDNVDSDAFVFDVTVEEPAPSYDADAFARDLLEMVAPICENYDGKKNNKVALKTVWDTMSQRYSTLSNEEKAKVVEALAKTDGTDLEKAMAFYNYACKKYGLTKFIEGRQVKALVSEHETGNSVLPIVVIVASSVAAITAIGVVIALKRRKALLAK